MRIFLLLLLSITSSQSFAVKSTPETAKIAIIIDDVGYRITDSNILKLPKNVTFSVLPHTPYGQMLATKGYEKHHEIMLHIPMEAQNGKALGPGGLTSNMGKLLIHKKLKKAFNEIPFAVGVNNHMGSLLTTLPQSMLWVMQFVKEKEMLFVDSITSPKSQASAVAKQLGIPTLERNVFLDNKLDHHYISQQFSVLINKAKEHKTAIAIAHPHPETIRSLRLLLPELVKHNVELVPISQLFEQQQHIQQSTLQTE